jgi:UDP-2-acetamido-2-deoxy-ribo-hexuluronate aminotransferase
MSDQIQFIDLSAQQKLIRPKIDAAINKVLNHGKYIMGPEVEELESRLAAYVGVKHCISVSSGTDALLMALMAYGVGPGDAVFTTPFTFFATAEVISLLGATPVFVDIDPQTFNIDPEKLEDTLSHFDKPLNPKGVIAVDLFGLPADYDQINTIARNYDLFVIEDAAQAFGANYKGRVAGSLADVATTSFFPAKPLGCYGDGGAIFTDNDDLAVVMSSIRVHGKGKDKYDNIRVGINGRLDTIQAAVLLEKLNIYPDEYLLRQVVAKRYTEALNDSSGLAFKIEPPVIKDGYESAWAQYSIVCDDRCELQNQLKQAGIPSVIYYVTPLHLLGAMKYLGGKLGDFPVAEHISRSILSLPFYPYLSETVQDEILSGFIV